jgi:diguanylate cyclase (GGDEF)-like protein/PAS domain S-box-containing protein
MAFIGTHDQLRVLAELAFDYTYRLAVAETVRVEWIGDGFTEVTGYESRLITCLEDWMGIVHPDDVELMRAATRSALDGQERVGTYRIRAKSGETRWLRDHVAPVIDHATGRVIAILGAVRDVSHEGASDTAATEELFRTLVENAPLGIYYADLQGHFLYGNRKAQEIVGYSRDSLIGKSFLRSNLLSPGDIARATLLLARSIRGESTGPDRFRICRRDGSHRTVEIWTALLRSRNRTMILGMVQDIEERIRNEQERADLVEQLRKANDALRAEVLHREEAQRLLSAAALKDPLTGLPNRVYFSDHLERATARAKREGLRVAVLFVDLDGFKEINDRLGHAAGDTVLRTLAARIGKELRQIDAVGRWGGDEFTVVLEDLTSAEEAAKVAQKLVRALSRPVALEGTEEKVSASIGIAMYPDNGRTLEDLIRAADRAMYRAKAHESESHVFFERRYPGPRGSTDVPAED